MCKALSSMMCRSTKSFTRISNFEKGHAPRPSRHHQEPRRLEHDYNISAHVLGTGLNGHVTLASSKTQSGQKFAVKTLQLSTATPRLLELMRLELANHLSLDHPHIVRLFDVYETSECIHLVMECMDGGEVFDRVVEKGALTEDETRRSVRQILLALAHMHNQGIVHRDVKLENCVYQHKGSDDLKLIDFGLSGRWDPMSDTEMHDAVGTMDYAAPEVLNKSYTNKCDLWSLGVTTVAMLTGDMPFFGTSSEMAEQIQRGSFSVAPDKWNTFSPDLQDFLQSLIDVNPHTRLSAQQALAHPWISKVPTTPLATMDVVARSLREFSRTPKFHRHCMEILAMSLPSEEQSTVREYFFSLDKGNHGSIDLDVIRSLMVDELQGADETQISEVLASLCRHDGDTMHYTEFVAAMVGSQFAVSDSLVESAFRRFDVSGSNMITADDCRAVCSDQMLNANIHDFIEAADKSGDGRVTLEDFGAYLRTAPRKRCGPVSQDDGASQNTAVENQPRTQKRPETLTRQLHPALQFRLVVVILLSFCLPSFCFSSFHRFSCTPCALQVDSPQIGRCEASAIFGRDVDHTTIPTTAALHVTKNSQIPSDAHGSDPGSHSEEGYRTNRHCSQCRTCVANACGVQLTASLVGTNTLNSCFSLD